MVLRHPCCKAMFNVWVPLLDVERKPNVGVSEYVHTIFFIIIWCHGGLP